MFTQGGLGTTTFSSNTTTATVNPMKDFEVVSPPEDSISALSFSPESIPQNLLVAGSWDNCVSIQHNHFTHFKHCTSSQS